MQTTSARASATKPANGKWKLSSSFRRVEGDETAILFEFVKARLRTPATAAQFLPIVIHPADWEFEGAIKSTGKRSEAEAVADAFLSALDRLGDGITKAHGFDGQLVSKVKVDAIRDEMKKRGFLEKNEKGHLQTALHLRCTNVASIVATPKRPLRCIPGFLHPDAAT
jgi:hypothetical protein